MTHFQSQWSISGCLNAAHLLRVVHCCWLSPAAPSPSSLSCLIGLLVHSQPPLPSSPAALWPLGWDGGWICDQAICRFNVHWFKTWFDRQSQSNRPDWRTCFGVLLPSLRSSRQECVKQAGVEIDPDSTQKQVLTHKLLNQLQSEPRCSWRVNT